MPFTGFFASSGDDRSAAVGNGLGDRISARTGHGVPKLKSMPPPSLTTSPPYADAAFSPSSFFALPPGLSPSELLDSPVLLSASNNLPSPTTGTIPIMNFNWNNNTSHISQQKEIKSDHNTFPEFSFHPQTHPFTASYGLQSWGYHDSPEPDLGSPDRTDAATELNSVQSFSTRAIDPNVEHSQQNQSLHDNQKFEDGYNWRKYGQKQVKGSENPRSYYKCTYPNCPIKKKVERSFDGRITEIVIRGAHNHPKPQSIRKSSSSSSASSMVIQSCSAQSHDTSRVMGRIDPSLGMFENSSVSNSDIEHTIRRSSPECDEVDEADGPDVKRWKSESGGHEGISVMGSSTVRQPRVVVQTISDVDILEDGYRWRKYGQKVVKGNPNPRSYYKCTSSDCQVRKHVERAPHDLRSVITTYEGKHNHDVPPARNRNTPYLIRNIEDSEISTCSENYSRPINFSSLYASLDHYDHPLVSRVKDEPRDEFFVDTFFA